MISALGPIAAAAPATGPFAPFVMAAASLVQPLLQIMQGCGQSCIRASSYADQAEASLKSVNREYFSRPNRTTADQQAAVQYAQGVLEWLRSGCNAVGGPAGSRCISERLVEGGSAPWCPTGTGCDWITLYLRPIQQDRPQLAGVSGALGSLFGGGGGGRDSTFLIIAALVIILIAKKRKG
jgi:hypothetical protein